VHSLQIIPTSRLRDIVQYGVRQQPMLALAGARMRELNEHQELLEDTLLKHTGESCVDEIAHSLAGI
jgi:hypothetical protein